MKASLPKMPNGSTKWDEAAVKDAQQFKQIIHDLNQKGPSAHAVQFADGVWRTWQRSFTDPTGWEPFSGTWPKAGVVDGSSGIAYRRKRSAPLMKESGFSSLPTPQARDHFPPYTVEYIAKKKAQGHGMSNLNDWLAHNTLPTPRASDAEKGGRGDLLTVLRGYETKHAGTLPTPTARDWRSGKASQETHGKNSRPLNEKLSAMSGNRSGRMNPRFREWMMTLPLSWTWLGD
jgi:hypothetical protein